jgi:hypothetical protein
MTGHMQRGARPLLVIVGWLIAASAATTVGVLAVRAVGASVVHATTSPLSQDQVESALTRGTQASPQQSTTTPSVTPGGVSRVLATPGGTIIARCLNGDATLLSWSPAQNYADEEIHAGPAPTATIIFETEGTEMHVRVGCPAGVPTAHITIQADPDND